MAVAPSHNHGALAFGPLAYGALFIAALPAGIIWWARALDKQLHLPAVDLPIVGGLVVALGAAIWIAGVIEIVRRGNGLPMNAFPPARYVTSGVYGIIAHPIYVGWTMACAGVSVQTGSAAGFWIVTPTVAIGCAALVLGYEGPDLRRRFGAQGRIRPWLSLPNDQPVPPRRSERVAAWLLVFVPWFVACQALMGGFGWIDAASAALGALLAPTRATLRRVVVQGSSATAVILVAPAIGGGPAVHLLWAAFAAEAVGARSRGGTGLAWLWLFLCAGYVTVSAASSIAGRDLLVFAGLGVLLWRPMGTVRLALDAAERLANSWRAWRLGPVRVISHGAFAGLAAAFGVVVAGTLAGPAALPAIAGLALSTLAGAAIWAQVVEGSSRLLRPFGYYGGIIGGLLGSGVMALMGQPMAVVLGATAVAAPWVHSLGRLRCLVQGCCHGAVTDPRYGIRVSNPHSRAVALANLEGQPIHATQLYSIAGNAIIGLLLLRVWMSGAPVWFVAGLYLIGAGFARFIEERYRGEPQTVSWFGLPVYQYLAIVSVLTGVLFTTLGGPQPPPHGSWFDAGTLAAAFAIGAVSWFAMGVDFPESSRRFARLSG